MKTILFVDDDVDITDAVAEMLGAEGYSITCLQDGVDALEHLRTGDRPDLIILDLHMPNMGGAEFLNVRSHDPLLQSIPVVLRTSAPRRDVAHLEHAVSETLAGVFDLEALLAAVRKALRKEEAASPRPSPASRGVP